MTAAVGAARATVLWTVLAAVLALPVVMLVFSGRSPRGARNAEPMDVLGTVPPFELLERGGRTIRAEDLRGTPWVVDFVYTSCPGPCPLLTGKMAALQTKLAGSRTRLVTVSVDPAHDTPEILRDYATKHGADPERWLFLTGPVDDVRALVRDGFHLAVAEAASPSEADGPITHSSRFVLVDAYLRIRRYASTDEPGALDAIARDAAQLENEEPDE